MNTGVDLAEVTERSWRQNWLLSSVWLLFLLFPLLSLWFSDEGQVTKVAVTVLMVIFAVIYVHGFKVATQRAVESEPTVEQWPVSPHLVGLLAMVALIWAAGGYAVLGIVPFVVSFAVFTLAWRVAIAAVVIGLLVVVVAPLVGGVYGDLWVLTPVTVTVSTACILIRQVDDREQERVALQTDLVLSDERTRVARDVHDVLGHSLTAVVLKAELTERLLARLDLEKSADQADVDQCRAELAEIQAISRRALAEIRSTVGGLRNPTLADEVAVARTVLVDAGVSLTVAGDYGVVPDRFRPMLAWVVREAVTNVVRHSRARSCVIEFGPVDGSVRRLMRITDDGVGRGSSVEGNGLRGLRERVEAAGASLRIGSGSATAPASADEAAAGTELEVLA